MGSTCSGLSKNDKDSDQLIITSQSKAVKQEHKEEAKRNSATNIVGNLINITQHLSNFMPNELLPVQKRSPLQHCLLGVHGDLITSGSWNSRINRIMQTLKEPEQHYTDVISFFGFNPISSIPSRVDSCKRNPKHEITCIPLS